MVNGAFNDRTTAHDFGFEQCDPRLKLGYRKRIEILAREVSGGVVGAAGKIVFHPQKVGRRGGDVKRAGRLFCGRCRLVGEPPVDPHGLIECRGKGAQLRLGSGAEVSVARDPGENTRLDAAR
jgi:hypothetical protein